MGTCGLEFDEKYTEIYNIYKDSDTQEDFIVNKPTTIANVTIKGPVAVTTIEVVRPTLLPLDIDEVLELSKIFVNNKLIFRFLDILRVYNKLNGIKNPDTYFEIESMLINKNNNKDSDIIHALHHMI